MSTQGSIETNPEEALTERLMRLWIKIYEKASPPWLERIVHATRSPQRSSRK